MIVMVESGRLGNQVFQYLALRSVARANERVVLLGFDHLRTVFDGVDASFVTIASNPLRHLVSFDYAQASRLPFVGAVSEDGDAEARRTGRGPVTIAEPAWFQTDRLLAEPALRHLSVKNALTDAAAAFLTAQGLTAAATIVVHVRAGDYRTWPSTDHPAILSPEWYRDRVQEIRSVHPGLAVIAIGDEPSYTREVIEGIDGAVEYATSGSEGFAQEFALMTVCRHAVLSASSFAFWGAYFAHLRHPDGVFVGPANWAGHASGSWYPEHIRAPFIDYR